MVKFKQSIRLSDLKLKLTVVILVILSALMSSVEAGTWRDDFEDEVFDGWALRNPRSNWFVFDGFLWARVQGARGLPGTADFLEFTASPGPYERFTVTLINPRSGRLGLGKLFFDAVAQSGFFYTFSPYHISALRIDPLGGWFVGGFRGWLPRNPGTLWKDELAKLTVRFDTGRFQVFADGQLRAEFEDPHFDRIEFITILIIAEDGMGGPMVDSFEISGPGIGGLSVQPKGKLATTWGQLKR